jgi:hypothetical protein
VETVLAGLGQRAFATGDGNERAQPSKGFDGVLVAAFDDGEPACGQERHGAPEAFGPHLPENIIIAGVDREDRLIRDGVRKQAHGDAVIVIHDQAGDALDLFQVLEDGRSSSLPLSLQMCGIQRLGRIMPGQTMTPARSRPTPR